MLQGVGGVQEVPARADLIDQIERQGLIVDRHSSHELPGHAENLVHEHHEGRRRQGAMIQPTAGVVDQVRAHEG